jgi:hypothetical protein
MAKRKDIFDSVRDLFSSPEPFKEGDPQAYDILNAMSDKEVKKNYMGVAPLDVPKEAQEELYKRFVAPHAHYNCSQCYGRGRSRWIEKLHQYEACQCLQRTIRKEIGKQHKEESGLYDPSGNKIKLMN